MDALGSQATLSRNGHDFIDEEVIHGLLNQPVDRSEVREIIAKSLSKTPLTVKESAALLNTTDPELLDEILQRHGS